MENQTGSKSYLFRSPLSVQFEITHQCNNDCIFCHNDLNRVKTITFENAKEVMDELVRANVFTVIFTGGEPLLHPELHKMIEYANSLNLEVGLITNGILLEERLDQILEVGKISRFQISILGHNSELHDKLVNNPGAFDKAINGLKMASERGVKVNVNTTITKKNIAHVEEVCKVVRKNGANSYSVTRYIPVNNTDDEMFPTIKEMNELLRALIRINKGFPVRMLNAMPYCSIENDIAREDYIKVLTRCDGGLTWGTITPLGDLVPCPCWQNDCGNILNTGMRNSWQESQFFKSLRTGDFYPEECKSCIDFKACLAGCRGCSSGFSGKVNGKDPYCPAC